MENQIRKCRRYKTEFIIHEVILEKDIISMILKSEEAKKNKILKDDIVQGMRIYWDMVSTYLVEEHEAYKLLYGLGFIWIRKKKMKISDQLKGRKNAKIYNEYKLEMYWSKYRKMNFYLHAYKINFNKKIIDKIYKYLNKEESKSKLKYKYYFS